MLLVTHFIIHQETETNEQLVTLKLVRGPANNGQNHRICVFLGDIPISMDFIYKLSYSVN